MNPSSQCLDIVKQFEDFRPWPYPDPGSALYQATPALRRKWGVYPPRDLLATLTPAEAARSGVPWTNGYGETLGVTIDTLKTTEAEALHVLVRRVEEFSEGVAVSLGDAPTTQVQFDAMVSLAYNIGLPGFQRSSVLKAHRRGDYPAAARAFALWNMSKGKVLAGLTRRRAAEAALYLSDVPVAERVSVDVESAMSSSPIVRGGTVAGVAAGAGAVAEVSRALRDTVDSLGSTVFLVAILAAVVIGAGVVVWQRLKQRREGWA
ncbi:MAG: lysozyme [Ottowia sp.]|uniref:lysozyme n=1 Tax=Ottowia sp. TaxID=1898956 RepID=UPI003C72C17D